MFSGPIQPPMLGAALASARLHLSDEITELQAQLARRVAFMNDSLAAAGMPQLVRNDSPLFFVPAGTTTVNYTIMKRMFGDGFYLNSAVYPAVPMRRGGLRFTVTNHVSEADIEAMVQSMSVHYRAVLKEQGLTMDDVHRTFKIPPVGVHPPASPQAVAAHRDPLQLRSADPEQPIARQPAAPLPA